MLPSDTASPSQEIHEGFGAGRHRVEASALICGNDLVVALQGGTHHHIGATSMAVTRPSLADPQRISSSASVLCVVGHKEDELARNAALRLSAMLDCTVTVVAGVHIDGATSDDIRMLLANCDNVIGQLAARLRLMPRRGSE